MAKKNNINAHRRPMTKVEKEVREQLMEEFHCRVHSNNHNRHLLDRKDLGEVIDRAMAGVTLLRIDHKASYQQWVDSCNQAGEWWWLHVGPITYKRIYNRVEELLKDRLDEIDNARWYCVNYKDCTEGDKQMYYVNADSDEEAREDVRSIWLWGNKLVSMFRATWDNVRHEFQLGQRVSLAGCMG